VHNLLVVQYSLQAKYQQALDAGIEALKMLGVELPQDNLAEAITAEFATAKENGPIETLARSSTIHP
jgi:hypothetical protein